jgi:proliferating cell nuclear antigen PCNA
MTIIFKAKTSSAYTVKVLAELLQNNIKTACFEINSDGIKLVMMDNNRTILTTLFLESENFTLYKFKNPSKMYVGINLNHLHKMLKSIKKKDSLEIYIDSDSPTDLGIKVIPKENNRISNSFIKIQGIQNLDIDIPTGYGKPVIVPSSEYSKTIKDMTHIGNTINIVAKNFHIEFKCNTAGVLKRNVEFGEFNENDDDSDDDNLSIYNQVFDTEQLSRITKLAGLSSNIQIFAKENLPLLFRTAVGTLGNISIYIKSKDQISKESCNIESDNEEEHEQKTG